MCEPKEGERERERERSEESNGGKSCIGTIEEDATGSDGIECLARFPNPFQEVSHHSRNCVSLESNRDSCSKQLFSLSLSLSLSSLEFSKFLVSRIFRFEFSKVPQGAFFAFVPSLATRERETPGRVGAETDSSGITGSREREPERAHTRPPSCSFHKRVYGAGG